MHEPRQQVGAPSEAVEVVHPPAPLGAAAAPLPPHLEHAVHKALTDLQAQRLLYPQQCAAAERDSTSTHEEATRNVVASLGGPYDYRSATAQLDEARRAATQLHRQRQHPPPGSRSGGGGVQSAAASAPPQEAQPAVVSGAPPDTSSGGSASKGGSTHVCDEEEELWTSFEAFSAAVAADVDRRIAAARLNPGAAAPAARHQRSSRAVAAGGSTGLPPPPQAEPPAAGAAGRRPLGSLQQPSRAAVPPAAERKRGRSPRGLHGDEQAASHGRAKKAGPHAPSAAAATAALPAASPSSKRQRPHVAFGTRCNAPRPATRRVKPLRLEVEQAPTPPQLPPVQPASVAQEAGPTAGSAEGAGSAAGAAAPQRSDLLRSLGAAFAGGGAGGSKGGKSGGASQHIEAAQPAGGCSDTANGSDRLQQMLNDLTSALRGLPTPSAAGEPNGCSADQPGAAEEQGGAAPGDSGVQTVLQQHGLDTGLMRDAGCLLQAVLDRMDGMEQRAAPQALPDTRRGQLAEASPANAATGSSSRPSATAGAAENSAELPSPAKVPVDSTQQLCNQFSQLLSASGAGLQEVRQELSAVQRAQAAAARICAASEQAALAGVERAAQAAEAAAAAAAPDAVSSPRAAASVSSPRAAASVKQRGVPLQASAAVIASPVWMPDGGAEAEEQCAEPGSNADELEEEAPLRPASPPQPAVHSQPALVEEAAADPTAGPLPAPSAPPAAAPPALEEVAGGTASAAAAAGPGAGPATGWPVQGQMPPAAAPALGVPVAMPSPPHWLPPAMPSCYGWPAAPHMAPPFAACGLAMPQHQAWLPLPLQQQVAVAHPGTGLLQQADCSAGLEQCPGAEDGPAPGSPGAASSWGADSVSRVAGSSSAPFERDWEEAGGVDEEPREQHQGGEEQEEEEEEEEQQQQQQLDEMACLAIQAYRQQHATYSDDAGEAWDVAVLARLHAGHVGAGCSAEPPSSSSASTTADSQHNCVAAPPAPAVAPAADAGPAAEQQPPAEAASAVALPIKVAAGVPAPLPPRPAPQPYQPLKDAAERTAARREEEAQAWRQLRQRADSLALLQERPSVWGRGDEGQQQEQLPGQHTQQAPQPPCTQLAGAAPQRLWRLGQGAFPAELPADDSSELASPLPPSTARPDPASCYSDSTPASSTPASSGLLGSEDSSSCPPTESSGGSLSCVGVGARHKARALRYRLLRRRMEAATGVQLQSPLAASCASEPASDCLTPLSGISLCTAATSTLCGSTVEREPPLAGLGVGRPALQRASQAAATQTAAQEAGSQLGAALLATPPFSQPAPPAAGEARRAAASVEAPGAAAPQELTSGLADHLSDATLSECASLGEGAAAARGPQRGRLLTAAAAR